MTPSISSHPIMNSYVDERDKLLGKGEITTVVIPTKSIEEIENDLHRADAINKMFSAQLKIKISENEDLRRQLEESQASLKPVFAQLAKIQRRYEEDVEGDKFWSKISISVSLAVLSLVGIFVAKKVIFK